MEQQFLRIAEVALLLGMTEEGVRWRIKHGELPYRRWGRSVLIPKRELEAFLAELPGCTATEAIAACLDDASPGEEAALQRETATNEKCVGHDAQCEVLQLID
jgi:excisionase family DNA binding protein